MNVPLGKAVKLRFF